MAPARNGFFCHASEDAPIVDRVYQSFVTRYPQYSAWLDKYEIVGGNSLIEKIGDAVHSADKFFIFCRP